MLNYNNNINNNEVIDEIEKAEYHHNKIVQWIYLLIRSVT